MRIDIKEKLSTGFINFKDISKISWKYGKKSLIFSLISAAISATTPLLTYWFSKNLFNVLLSQNIDMIDIFKIFFIYTVFTLIINCSKSRIDHVVLSVENEKIKKNISLDFHKKVVYIDLFNFDISTFFDKYTRAVNETESQIINFISIFSNFIRNILVICTTSVVVAISDPIIIFIVLITIVAPVIFQVFVNKIVYNSIMERTKPQRFVHYVKTVFSSKDYAIELRSTDVKNILLNKYVRNWDTLISLTKKYQTKLLFFINLITVDNILFSYALPMLYLAYKVYKGIVPCAEMMALFSVISEMTSALSNIIDVIPNLYKSILFYDNFKQIYDYVPQITNSINPVHINPLEPHEIEFKNVVFHYPNCNDPAINDLSFKIEKKSKIALLGLNGAGKTTIIKLLLRLYEPKSGEIYIDGINIREIDLNDLRASFSTVQQNYKIYALSVKENITLNENSKDSDESILSAIEKSGLSEYLKNHGYSLGNQVTRQFDDNGIEFSGGYNQRLAISRALASNSGNIIMDEPSAALDPYAEKELFDMLSRSFQNKTQIIISHRMTNASDFDKIIVIDKGSLVAEGSHSELIQYENKYKELYELQLSKYELKS